jgi:hypothetical protein
MPGYSKSEDRKSRVLLMKGNVQIFPGIAQRISMATRWKREEKDTFIQDVSDNPGEMPKGKDLKR